MAVRLHHVGVHVEDLGRSIAFYEAVFGMRVVQRFVLGDEELAFLDAGAGLVELIADGGGGRASAGVVDHVAFQVGDLEEWGRVLAAHGVVALDAAPIAVPALGARIRFWLGPDGERIELIEARSTV
jgi:catechol 2,3-dioxygenase-like lactoylglutathione lyase family enzyme